MEPLLWYAISRSRLRQSDAGVDEFVGDDVGGGDVRIVGLQAGVVDLGQESDHLVDPTDVEVTDGVVGDRC